ncbi:glycosyl transferase [Butyrivibrio fibrisolvens]|uniref:Glycosyl transferase n=2 Tax=Butyrivibrio fibrisolvens TaxID=831 RepID=A0A317FWX4_BUTFI|nr:glycosyl transferase [Butyrivibrio fibrisolvens]
MIMKKISIVVPCYNEENSIEALYKVITDMFHDQLSSYDYELILADDFSKDRTREIIARMCKEDKHVKAVFNMANFGFSRNVFSALQEMTGDAAFLVFGDMQDPPQLLPEFIKKWEAGCKVVIGQKTASDENKFMTFMRKRYYGLIRMLSERPQIEEFNGYGLYDKKFIDILRDIDDVQPYLKTVVSEYAPNHGVVYYHHQKSVRGKSNFNFYKNYDFAMEGITSSTKKLLRIATFLGAGLGLFSIIYSIYVFVMKLISPDSFPAGTASIMIGVYIIGSAQLFFIGVLGEYMLSVNLRTMKKPRVVVDKRLNFDNDDDVLN